MGDTRGDLAAGKKSPGFSIPEGLWKTTPMTGLAFLRRRKPAIKFADLTPAQKRKVEDKAVPGFYKTAERKKYCKASNEARSALRAVLTRLGNEPLTTGALFLVAGAFLELASQIVSKFDDVQRGEAASLGEIDAPDWFDGIGPTATQQLVEAYIPKDDSSYWQARYAEMEAEDEWDTERTRILDETAAALFGNNGNQR